MRWTLVITLFCQASLWAQVPFLAVEPLASPQKISLSQAFELALAHNENLLSGHEEIAVQRGFAKQSLSGILPTLHGVGFLSDQMGLGANLKIPVLNLSGVLSSQGAFKQIKSVEHFYERKRDTLFFDVANAYLNALLEQHLLALAKVQHQASETRLASAERKSKLKEIPRLDLKRAELLAARTKAQILNREATLRAALGQLAYFMGKNEVYELEDVPKMTGLEALEIKPDRSDLKAQSIAVHAAWLTEKSAGWLFSPTLHVSTSLKFPVQDSYRLQASLDLMVPFFDGMNRYGLYETARARLRQEKFKKQLLERQIALEVQGALVDIERFKKVYEVQKDLVEISLVAFSSAESRYQMGQATSLDVLDEQTRLFEAQTELLKTEVNIGQARLRLNYVLGDPRKGLLQNG